MTDKKKKRRNSQVFHFEQSEETLENNEGLINLYKNKNYRAPEVAELEMLTEELDGSVHCNKRGRNDGSLVIGKGKSKRVLDMNYKYWKQDDKERCRRRKTMIQKLWKGRKKVKIVPLSEELEQRLLWMIETKEQSEDEGNDEEELGCVWMEMTRRHNAFLAELQKKDYSEDLNILSRLNTSEEVCEETTGNVTISCPRFNVRLSEENVEKERNTEGNLNAYDSFLEFITERDQIIEAETTDTDIDLDIVAHVNTEVSNDIRVTNNEELDAGTCSSAEVFKVNEGKIHVEDNASPKMAREVEFENNEDDDIVKSLATLIPADDLQNLLECDDLLFCGRRKKDDKRRESSRRSVRRSVRLSTKLVQDDGHVQGSVFVEEDISEDQAINGKSKKDTGENKGINKDDDTSGIIINDKEHLNDTKDKHKNGDDTKENCNSVETPAPVKVSSRRRRRPKRKPLEVLEDQLLDELSNLAVSDRLEISKKSNGNNADDVKMSVVPDIIVTESTTSKFVDESEAEDTLNIGSGSRRRSSVLGSSYGEMNISMPPAVRRSNTPRSSLSLSPSIAGEPKVLLSDSDEEIISGIFGTKTLGHRYMKKQYKSKIKNK